MDCKNSPMESGEGFWFEVIWVSKSLSESDKTTFFSGKGREIIDKKKNVQVNFEEELFNFKIRPGQNSSQKKKKHIPFIVV